MEFYVTYVYLAIIMLILLVIFSSYYYFSTHIVWTVDIDPKTIYEQQEEDKIVDDLRKQYEAPKTPYSRLAKRIQELERIQRGATQFHIARLEKREELLRSSERAKSEVDKGRRGSSKTTLAEEKMPEKENLEESSLDIEDFSSADIVKSLDPHPIAPTAGRASTSSKKPSLDIEDFSPADILKSLDPHPIAPTAGKTSTSSKKPST